MLRDRLTARTHIVMTVPRFHGSLSPVPGRGAGTVETSLGEDEARVWKVPRKTGSERAAYPSRVQGDESSPVPVPGGVEMVGRRSHRAPHPPGVRCRHLPLLDTSAPHAASTHERRRGHGWRSVSGEAERPSSAAQELCSLRVSRPYRFRGATGGTASQLLSYRVFPVAAPKSCLPFETKNEGRPWISMGWLVGAAMSTAVDSLVPFGSTGTRQFQAGPRNRVICPTSLRCRHRFGEDTVTVQSLRGLRSALDGPRAGPDARRPEDAERRVLTGPVTPRARN